MHQRPSEPFTQPTTPRFEVKQSAKLNLTSYSGLALIGQCCQAAQVEAVIDPRLPVSQGMRTSDLVKSMVGLLSLGKSDFEAIEPFRSDRFFKEALGLAKVPGSVWMRQRLDARAAELRELTDELSLRLLERTEAPITGHKGYVCADMDTFVMDNSDTKRKRSAAPTRASTATRRSRSTWATRAPEFDSYARKPLFLLDHTFKNATTTAPTAPAPLVFLFLRHEAPRSVPC
ncbi:hypothetical protein MASR2M16_25810 [Thauera terpenica]